MAGIIDHLSQVPDDPPDTQAQQEQTFEFYGAVKTKVVGVRYYTGEVNKREMVLMVREPENPYDRWAIRVDNVRHDKVGHVAREQASTLSPLIDQGLLRIEGTVVGDKGVYTMPIMLCCYGPSDKRDAVVRRLRTGGIVLEGSYDAYGSAGGGAGGKGRAAAGGVAPRMAQSELDTSLERLFDDIHAASPMQPALQPDQEVISRLFPHQRVALAWMVAREDGNSLPPFWEARPTHPVSYINSLTNFAATTRPAPLRGGILADDMGLGKTLTVISLIATSRPGATLPATEVISLGVAPSEGEQAEQQPDKGAKGRPGKRRKTAAGSAAGGAGPSTSAAPPAAGGIPGASPNDPPPTRPAPDGPRGTLIVCPVSVLSNWQQQLEEHTAGNLKVYTYHGPDRSRSPSFLSGHDVVLTTYSMLGADMGDKRGLLSVKWLRVVLDEAHTVKNPKAQMSQAAARLKAERRWAVTGTPIQNRLQDLYGLLVFLDLELLRERTVFNATLDRPLKACDPRAVKKLQVLMGTIAMRRTKDLRVGGRPLVVLPRKTITLVPCHLTREDRTAYDALELEGRRVVSGHLADSTLLSNYLNVLEIILRLRQVACAGCLCPQRLLPTGQAGGPEAAAAPLSVEERERLIGLLRSGVQDDCPVCLEPLNQTACITRCRHIFCRGCLENVVARAAAPSCPLCRAAVALADVLDAPPEEEARAAEGELPGGANPEAASAKVARLMTALRANAANPPADGQGPTKSVVFSSFTGMLDLIGAALRSAGLPFVRLDGSVPAQARADMVRAFASRQEGSPVVFLASLKAGGVGVNLTAANQVHLMEPWWNPAVEDQAMARDMGVFRFVANDTIEERTLLLQERKRELANAAFDRRSADENRQMRLDDVRLLMDL